MGSRVRAHPLATFPETFPGHLRQGPLSPADNRRFGAVLMGRRTYDVGLVAGITSPYPTFNQFVFSRSLSVDPAQDVTVVAEGAAGFAVDTYGSSTRCADDSVGRGTLRGRRIGWSRFGVRPPGPAAWLKFSDATWGDVPVIAAL